MTSISSAPANGVLTAAPVVDEAEINPNGYDDLEAVALRLVREGCNPDNLWLAFRRYGGVGGSQPEVCDRVRYRDYDENQVRRSLPPGEYFAQLMTIGEGKKFRGIRCTRGIQVHAPVGGIVEPLPALPVAITAGGTDPVLQFYREALQKSDERINKLLDAIGKGTAAPAAAPPMSQLFELVEGMDRLQKMVRPRNTEPPATEWGAIFRDGISVLRDALPTLAPAQRPAPAPGALPSAGPGPSDPAASAPQTSAVESQGAVLVTLLLTGAKADVQDPAMYASLVSDFLEGNGQDPEAMLKIAPAGAMVEQYIAAYPALADYRPFLVKVEQELREIYRDSETPSTGDDE